MPRPPRKSPILERTSSAAELGLFAIFAACEANKARLAEVRQAKAQAATAGRKFWWQEENDRDSFEAYEQDD